MDGGEPVIAQHGNPRWQRAAAHGRNYFRDTGWKACNKREPGSGCAALDGFNRRLAVLGVNEHCIANHPGDFANALAALGANADVLARIRDLPIRIEDLL